MAMANADNSGTGTSADAVSSNRNANREFIRKECKLPISFWLNWQIYSIDELRRITPAQLMNYVE